MNKQLTKVALRYRAIYLDIHRDEINMESEATAPVLAFVKSLGENGFCVSEELLHALNAVPSNTLMEITGCINNVMGVKLNWVPLVKGWNNPTGESRMDHFVTLLANLFGGKDAGIKGTNLPCGHFIPENTFPIERYNGCPFCGTPFETSDFVYTGQGSKMKELRLFTDQEMQNLFISLLSSSTPLEATQKDALEQLLNEYPLPADVNIPMKETTMFVIKKLVEQGKDDEASEFMKTPTDVLRYLWFEKTGYAQIIEPKTLIANANRKYSHMCKSLDIGAEAAKSMKAKLMLKYDRKVCLRVAKWMNAIPMTAMQAAENMHPKRGMWVRFIRALRLGEYSRKRGMEHLAEIMDVFYKQNYTTWQGVVDKARLENNADETLSLLKKRPGLFARCLFATMLRFGSDKVLAAFDEVADHLPMRLLLSLGNAAEIYFDPTTPRVARPITGVTHSLEPHKLLFLYDEQARKKMVEAVNDIYRNAVERHFSAQKTDAQTIFIDPTLYQIPVSVGDRSTTIQDTSCALMGTRFPVEGDAVRLFLQWGKGLPAQMLDMDLSCRIAYPNGDTEYCYYGNLTCVGAKHSGDIQSIPNMVGTAEYIELSLPELEKAGAQYVTFACNAYSCGELSPNLVVGWMDSANPMKLSEESGVAYDPSCVQHMVRISEGNLSKGLVFGVLDVAKREIIWLEMAFTSQIIHNADSNSINAILRRLEEKLSVGEFLEMKAKAQNLKRVEVVADADEAYTYEWALNPADVSKLLNI
ncbi:MAG: hypothetical protein MJZ28_11165 [Paludibacteraceae bacterium]|nr:hypothetical protein [Paludibacteraceae bacterium]